jgi:hypothetical protein
MMLVGMTAYDTIFPGALIRVTFQKAHFWHPASVFATESRKVYNRLSSIAHVYPAQPFPVAGDAVTWTIDVRTQQERQVSEIARTLNDACDISGTVNVVEVARMEILSQEKVKGSNTAVGARERANEADAATATAASNPLDAATTAAKGAFNALGNVGKYAVLALVALAIILVLTRRK